MMEQAVPVNGAGSYRLVDLSPARRIVVSLLDLATWGHGIFGLIEGDVTEVRQCLDEYEARTGERLSFTGHLIRAYFERSRGRHCAQARVCA